jgi:hypothetical protein
MYAYVVVYVTLGTFVMLLPKFLAANIRMLIWSCICGHCNATNAPTITQPRLKLQHRPSSIYACRAVSRRIALSSFRHSPMASRQSKQHKLALRFGMRLKRKAVAAGKLRKTSGGLTKEMLIKNKSNKTVSKQASEAARRRYEAGGGFARWVDFVKSARHDCGITGFCPIGGRTRAGQALYSRAKFLQYINEPVCLP